MARSTQDSLREQSRQMDCLYNETDRLYNGFARSCGLSECAYWVMYEIEVSSGSASLRGMAEAFSLSKQTLSSAVKSLEAKGLIELSFEEGSRKNKVASFTEAGRAFSREASSRPSRPSRAPLARLSPRSASGWWPLSPGTPAPFVASSTP